MRNAGLEEAQAGIKIAGRNINNLRYADDTTLMAESEEEVKSLLLKVKGESEKVGLKFNITVHCMCVSRFSCVRLFVTLWTIACQAPLCMGFPRQEYWSGLPFPSTGDLPDQGTELQSPALQTDSLPSELVLIKHEKFSGIISLCFFLFFFSYPLRTPITYRLVTLKFSHS